MFNTLRNCMNTYFQKKRSGGAAKKGKRVVETSKKTKTIEISKKNEDENKSGKDDLGSGEEESKKKKLKLLGRMGGESNESRTKER